jgi:hypothetical protein
MPLVKVFLNSAMNYDIRSYVTSAFEKQLHVRWQTQYLLKCWKTFHFAYSWKLNLHIKFRHENMGQEYTFVWVLATQDAVTILRRFDILQWREMLGPETSAWTEFGPRNQCCIALGWIKFGRGNSSILRCTVLPMSLTGKDKPAFVYFRIQ